PDLGCNLGNCQFPVFALECEDNREPLAEGQGNFLVVLVQKLMRRRVQASLPLCLVRASSISNPFIRRAVTGAAAAFHDQPVSAIEFRRGARWQNLDGAVNSFDCGIGGLRRPAAANPRRHGVEPLTTERYLNVILKRLVDATDAVTTAITTVAARALLEAGAEQAHRNKGLKRFRWHVHRVADIRRDA